MVLREEQLFLRCMGGMRHIVLGGKKKMEDVSIEVGGQNAI